MITVKSALGPVIAINTAQIITIIPNINGTIWIYLTDNSSVEVTESFTEVMKKIEGVK